MTDSKFSNYSPTAQTVLNAYRDGVWVKGSYTHVAGIAAVLRAVADQLTFEDSLAGAVISPRELLDIATELENV